MSEQQSDKATPKYRWLDGSAYLDPVELAKSKSFRDKIKETAALEKEVRQRQQNG